MTRIGAQGFTLRQQFVDLGITEVFRRVAEVGYRSIEISAVEMSPDNVAEIGAASKEHGVSVDATSAPLSAPEGRESLATDAAKVAEDALALGSSHVRIGMFPASAFGSAEVLAQTAKQANDAALVLADRGVTLCYHNHAIEYARYEGRKGLDLILEAAPDLRLELDVHWVQRGGGDPVTELRRYADRIDLVHLKDYRVPVPRPDALADPSTHSTLLKVVEFAEVGEGSLDFDSIIDTSIAIGAVTCFVEQDQTYDRDAFEALALSHRNIVALGYGGLL